MPSVYVMMEGFVVNQKASEPALGTMLTLRQVADYLHVSVSTVCLSNHERPFDKLWVRTD